MDAHGLLLELEYELKVLTDPNNTHVGIGFAVDNGCVKIVELVAQRPIVVETVQSHPEPGSRTNGIIITGRALKEPEGQPPVGLYAARLVAASKQNKDIKAIGTHYIEMPNPLVGPFTMTIPGPFEDENQAFYSDTRKFILFYVRTKAVNAIGYGDKSEGPDERIKAADLQLCLAMPCEYSPDPRLAIWEASID